MAMVFMILTGLCLLALLGSLAGGLLAMGGDSEESNKRSQMFMRARILLQGLALVFLVLTFLTWQS